MVNTTICSLALKWGNLSQQSMKKRSTHYHYYTGNIYLEEKENDPLISLASCPREKVPEAKMAILCASKNILSNSAELNQLKKEKKKTKKPQQTKNTARKTNKQIKKKNPKPKTKQTPQQN